MKRTLLLTVMALLVLAQTGCFHHWARPQHAGCNCAGGGLVGGGLAGGGIGGNVAHAVHETQGWRHQRPEMGPPGPPTGTVAYPYYTLHGPRDFLVDNPPSIGN
jgi:hypothetical protein